VQWHGKGLLYAALQLSTWKYNTCFLRKYPLLNHLMLARIFGINVAASNAGFCVSLLVFRNGFGTGLTSGLGSMPKNIFNLPAPSPTFSFLRGDKKDVPRLSSGEGYQNAVRGNRV
jgi:hypothetical protein